jgi:hypothetical protein
LEDQEFNHGISSEFAIQHSFGEQRECGILFAAVAYNERYHASSLEHHKTV